MIALDFHHIGVGTTRFDEAIRCYVAMGHELLLSVDDPGINARIAFVRRANGPLIEILAPLGEGGPLRGLIARKTVPGPYHTCYCVPELTAASDFLRELGFVPVTSPQPAVAFGGKPVQFLFGREIGLVEVVENPPSL